MKKNLVVNKSKFKVAEPVYGTDGKIFNDRILKVDIKVYIKDAHTGTIEFELHDSAGFSNHEHYSILKFAQDEIYHFYL